MYKFNENDIFKNVVIAYPSYEFLLYSGSIFYQNRKSDNSNVPDGHLSLYELNVNRSSNKIYPFITKNGTLDSFKTISTSDFNSSLYGDILSGTYELTSTIATKYYNIGDSRPQINALKNTLNYYYKVSKKYKYDTNFSNAALSQISIPSIFYGSQIEKGSIELEFYYTGTLIAKAQDIRRNGELVQTYGTSSVSGSTVGVVLYNEGFILLTSSADLAPSTDAYLGTTQYKPAWIYFAANQSAATASACKIKYNGTSKTPTITMFAHADKVDLNHSNNPTYAKYGQKLTASSSPKSYVENSYLEIKNIVSGVYNNYSESFERTTFISSVGIYNEDRVLIGIAKVATPVRKRNNDSYTFKLKLDL
jgi:hypothetical protein